MPLPQPKFVKQMLGRIIFPDAVVDIMCHWHYNTAKPTEVRVNYSLGGAGRHTKYLSRELLVLGMQATIGDPTYVVIRPHTIPGDRGVVSIEMPNPYDSASRIRLEVTDHDMYDFLALCDRVSPLPKPPPIDEWINTLFADPA